jgi:hypothetical protein
MENAVQQNGVMIVRTPKGIAVGTYEQIAVDQPLELEVSCSGSGGKFVKKHFLNPNKDLPYRDYFGDKIDHLSLGIKVKVGQRLLAELPAPDGVLPFMRLVGEQVHITENYVSVPPALTITDEVGAIWTLGFTVAQERDSPDGEYAFNVLRDGIDTGEIASRIERRNSKIRIFTRHGWKRWTGNIFF